MTAHGYLPVVTGIQRCAAGLRADGGGKQQDFSAHQRQAASGLGEPLVPADPHAEAPERRVPDTKTAIARAEVFLLLVAYGVRNVGLAIHTQQAPVGISHAQ
ncbi:hypothetical protein D3C85_1298460 [compost metagenome]